MAANHLPYGAPLPDPPPPATASDLLQGRQPGWREHEGGKVPTELDPIRLVQHFRRLGPVGTAWDARSKKAESGSAGTC